MNTDRPVEVVQTNRIVESFSPSFLPIDMSISGLLMSSSKSKKIITWSHAQAMKKQRTRDVSHANVWANILHRISFRWEYILHRWQENTCIHEKRGEVISDAELDLRRTMRRWVLYSVVECRNADCFDGRERERIVNICSARLGQSSCEPSAARRSRSLHLSGTLALDECMPSDRFCLSVRWVQPRLLFFLDRMICIYSSKEWITGENLGRKYDFRRPWQVRLLQNVGALSHACSWIRHISSEMVPMTAAVMLSQDCCKI